MAEPFMIARLFSLSAVALALAAPGLALADVPGGDGGASTADAGINPDCTVKNQSDTQSCSVCNVADSDTNCQLQLGDDYNYVCNYSPTVEVWCNGPNGMVASDTTTSATSCAMPSGN